MGVKLIVFSIALLLIACTKENQNASVDHYCIVVNKAGAPLYLGKSHGSSQIFSVKYAERVNVLSVYGEDDQYSQTDISSYPDQTTCWVQVEYIGKKGYMRSYDLYPMTSDVFAYSRAVLGFSESSAYETGIVRGKVVYPSEGIPLGLILIAYNVTTKEIRITRNFVNNGLSYYFNEKLPYGRYRLYLENPFNEKKVSRSPYRIYYRSNGSEDIIVEKGSDAVVEVENL